MSYWHRRTNELSLILILTVFLLATAGCQTGGSSPAVKKSAAAPVPQEINFFDVNSFDSKLSKALSSGAPDLTVTMLAPVSLNDVPERLDKRFSAVEKYERRKPFASRKGAKNANAEHRMMNGKPQGKKGKTMNREAGGLLGVARRAKPEAGHPIPTIFLRDLRVLERSGRFNVLDFHSTFNVLSSMLEVHLLINRAPAVI